MRNEWEPTESDCQWVRETLRVIAIGGLWRTSFALYQKIGEHSLKLLTKIYAPRTNTDVNIARTEKILRLIGWEYIDKDINIVLMPDNPMEMLKEGEDFIAVADGELFKAKLTKCSHCGYWFIGLNCPYCSAKDTGFVDHRHGREP